MDVSFKNIEYCIMNNMFKINQTVPYNLRKRNVLQIRNPNSVKYGTKTISYEFEKWRAIRGSVGGVLVCVAWMAWVEC